VVHTRNLSTLELRQEDFELETSLGYIVRPQLRKKKKKIQTILKPKSKEMAKDCMAINWI
jgi:hypothetical protein